VHLLLDIGVDPIEIGKPSQQARQLLARIYPGGVKAEHLYERQKNEVAIRRDAKIASLDGYSQCTNSPISLL